MAAPKKPDEIFVSLMTHNQVTLRLIGQTPLYYNSMSAKAKRTLLIGGGRKTAAEKKELKHDPYEEFRSSTCLSADGPTALVMPSPAVKGAMSTAALETPGLNRTTVWRMLFLPEAHIKVWGDPYLKMDVVRSADMNKTPDVRTRAYLPEWCAEVTLRYVTPALSNGSVYALLANAGILVGLGDYRQEKGRGNNGSFVVEHENGMTPEGAEVWNRLTSEQGRVSQLHRLEHPMPAEGDLDTADLLQFFDDERRRRSLSAA